MNIGNRTERHVSRADLHVHSTASQLSKLGIQRSLALPECATEPEEVYELAKRRGITNGTRVTRQISSTKSGSDKRSVTSMFAVTSPHLLRHR